ncbi:MAG: hypothetical protein UY10_C0035G0009 [Microgenomates group bacterium GW2011_GWA2_47_8]|nr:MAG: hypothetical protein UY10_C0035G0009 [Microgenomates group bacterium GW2011_GWA2_47_8]
MLPQPPKKKLPSYTANSVIESLRDMGSGVSKTIARDVVGRVSSDVLTSLFGYNTASESAVDQSQKAYSHEIGPEPFSVRPETKISRYTPASITSIFLTACKGSSAFFGNRLKTEATGSLFGRVENRKNNTGVCTKNTEPNLASPQNGPLQPKPGNFPFVLMAV